MEQFDAYFRRADLDGDGRISGAEAVAFFQGSNLPKHVLAQVWMHADPAGTGFLGRAEFYNALKLVTVAQSKRELTPDIVKAALYGPAAAKIPAPQINLAAIPSPQPNQMTTTPAPQMGAVAPTASQNLGFRGQTLPNPSTNQQYFPSQQNQFMRPPQPMPAGSASRPPQNLAGPELNRGGNMVGPGVPNSNISSDWLSGRTAGAPTGPLSQVPNRGITPSMPPPTTKPLDLASTPKAPVVSGNGFASDPVFGGNVFSATPTQQKRDSSGLTYSVSSSPASSVALSPAPTGSPSLSKPSSLDSLQSAFTMGPAGGQIQRAQSAGNLNQPAPPQSTSPLSSSGVSVGVGNSASNQSQLPWPRMTPSDVQKYTKVFIEVDSDRDGKITGEQARNLFLSWRLPREVLKQVWDLSDQDSDSMLSLREFCTALYLMERYREGRPLPAVLPSNILFDETLFPMMGQQASFGNAARPPTPGLSHQHGIPGVRQMTTAPGLGPPIQVALQGDGAMQPNQQKISGLVSEDVFGNQLSNGEKNGLNLTHQDVTDSEKKVEATENVILDSKEKIELYRTKMQELVLYKSRCDNRLNEITERASSDKREAEFVTKKYEEKYKQVAEIASKLAMEDARFRDLQGRKNELHQAIIKMEQGGSADGILQVRADRIQSDLEELIKALTDRCKKHGLDVKSTAIIELPIGWEPGFQEGAAIWDEDWDKFDDEGLSFAKDCTVDVQNGVGSPKSKSTSIQKDNASSFGEHGIENESAYTHSEDDLARSPPGSPGGRTSLESPSQELSNNHFRKSSEADTEIHRSFDEPNWEPSFDHNDDTDSIWGFNPSTTKDFDSDKHRENDIFGSGNLGINPIRTESPHDDPFQRKSPFSFEDSVPSTPLSKFGNSPRYSEWAGEHHFDMSSRFDSFSMHDGGFSPPRETLTRFDSISSSRDFGHGQARFDSLNSGRDFGPGHARFDSISSSRGFDHGQTYSFDDSDPFGSTGPFKVSSDNQTPRKGSDNWGF